MKIRSAHICGCTRGRNLFMPPVPHSTERPPPMATKTNCRVVIVDFQESHKKLPCSCRIRSDKKEQ